MNLVRQKIICALLLSALSNKNALAQGELEIGVELYNSGRLDKAASCFIARLAKAPNDASAHYLLGNVFLARQQMAMASSEYRKCIALDSGGQAGQLSRIALSSITIEIRASRKEGSETFKTVESKVAMANVDNPKKVKMVGSDELASASNSASVISRETEERAKGIAAERDSKIQQIMWEGDLRVKRLEQAMQERINGMKNLVPAVRANRTYPFAESEQLVKDEYAPQIEAIKHDTRRRSADAVSYYNIRTAAILDSAIALDKAYLSHNGSLRLNPLGTNAYVRSYETVDEPSGELVPIAAPPAKRLNELDRRH